MNSCQQPAQIPPALCSERAGREQGEQEGGISIPEWPHGAIGLERWEIRCISYLDHGVGGESRHIPKIANGSCLIGKFTAVCDPPASGEGLTLLDMLKCWTLLGILRNQKGSAKQPAGGKRLFKGSLPRLCTSSAVFGG